MQSLRMQSPRTRRCCHWYPYLDERHPATGRGHASSRSKLCGSAGRGAQLARGFDCFPDKDERRYVQNLTTVCTSLTSNAWIDSQAIAGLIDQQRRDQASLFRTFTNGQQDRHKYRLLN